MKDSVSIRFTSFTTDMQLLLNTSFEWCKSDKARKRRFLFKTKF